MDRGLKLRLYHFLITDKYSNPKLSCSFSVKACCLGPNIFSNSATVLSFLLFLKFGNREWSYKKEDNNSFAKTN